MVDFIAFGVTSVTYYIGKELIQSAIKETANSTYGILYKFIDHPEIDLVLHGLDTKAQLQNVETLMKNIDLQSINEPIYNSLNQLHQIMCCIMDDLCKIKYEVDKYKTKWFKKFRGANYKIHLERLKINHQILEKRLANLFQLLKIKHCFYKKNYIGHAITNIKCPEISLKDNPKSSEELVVL